MTNKNTLNNRIISLDILRVFLMLMIVWGHTSSIVVAKYWQMSPFIFISDFCGPVAVGIFFLLSGYLASRKNRDLMYFIKKGINILLLIAVWGTIFCFSFLTATGKGFPSVGGLLNYTYNFFKVGGGFLWFGIIIALLYFLTPLVNLLLSKAYKSFLAILASSIIVLNIFYYENLIKIFRLESSFWLFQNTGSLKVLVGSFLSGFILYSLGVLIRAQKAEKIFTDIPNFIYITIIFFSLASLAYVSSSLSNISGHLFVTYDRVNYILPLLATSISIFIIFLKAKTEKLSANLRDFIVALSLCCLGVYLLHLNLDTFYVNYIPLTFPFHKFSVDVIFKFVTISALSFLIIYLLSKSPLKKLVSFS